MAGKTRSNPKPGKRDGRKFVVSHNRSHKSHRVRYVETGGAAVDPEECSFCEAMPTPEEPSGGKH